MYTCAHCQVLACASGDRERLPHNCPIRSEALQEAAHQRYLEPEINRFFQAAAWTEKTGYCQWPRLRETLEFCRRMGYRKLGVAFCMGLQSEARAVCGLLRRAGFEVVSVICKNGAWPKESVGIGQEGRLRDAGAFEPMCNPIAQAELLNQQQTEFNISIGLCVGHDALFNRYSEAMVTTLIAKDRALAHNPAAAIYCGYCKVEAE